MPVTSGINPSFLMSQQRLVLFTGGPGAQGPVLTFVSYSKSSVINITSAKGGKLFFFYLYGKNKDETSPVLSW